METRELFWDIGSLGYILFYVVAWGAIAVFLIGFARHFVKYFRARKSPVPLHIWRGLSRMVMDIFSHRTLVRRDRAAGEAHRTIFYGFAILFIATSIITVDYDITGPALGVSFWKGAFYLAFSLVVDIAGIGLLAGIFFMMWRRYRQRPEKLDYLRAHAGEEGLRPQARRWVAEDALFLWALALIILTGYLQEAVRLVHEQPPWAGWSPVGWLVAEIFSGLGGPGGPVGVQVHQGVSGNHQDSRMVVQIALEYLGPTPSAGHQGHHSWLWDIGKAGGGRKCRRFLGF